MFTAFILTGIIAGIGSYFFGAEFSYLELIYMLFALTIIQQIALLQISLKQFNLDVSIYNEENPRHSLSPMVQSEEDIEPY